MAPCARHGVAIRYVELLCSRWPVAPMIPWRQVSVWSADGCPSIPVERLTGLLADPVDGRLSFDSIKSLIYPTNERSRNPSDCWGTTIPKYGQSGLFSGHWCTRLWGKWGMGRTAHIVGRWP